MSRPITFHVFLASPGDVGPERDAAARVLEGFSDPTQGRTVVCRRWEDLVPPGAKAVDGDFQQLVFRHMTVEECDIFLGIFWGRIGTPTLRAEGGSVEETEQALRLWKEEGRPRIMLYFCNRPIPEGQADPHQVAGVKSFLARVKEVAIPREFTDDFEAKLRNDLTNLLKEWPRGQLRDQLRLLNFDTAEKLAEEWRDDSGDFFAEVQALWAVEPDPVRKACLCYALGLSGGEAAMEFLAEVVEDDVTHPLIRREAARALGLDPGGLYRPVSHA
jgi:hypothetical protein